MCDSNHLSTTKTTDNQMPPDDGLTSTKPNEHFIISSPSNHIRPNPEFSDLDVEHLTTTINSSSDQSNSNSDFQPHQSPLPTPPFDVVQNTPTWRDRLHKESKAGVNVVTTKSTRNLEHHPTGNDTKYAPSRGSMEDVELCPSASSTGEARIQFSAGRDIMSESISGRNGNGMLDENSSCIKKSNGSQKDAMCFLNDTTTFVDSFRDVVAYGDEQNFRAYMYKLRSETDACADGNEVETRLGGVSVETKPRGSETSSRHEPYNAETKPGLDETCETKTSFSDLKKPETGFGDIGKSETGFDETRETETGFGDTTETETGFGGTRETETGFDDTRHTGTGFGDTRETLTGFGDIEKFETGFGDTGETETGFNKHNSKQNRRSASSSSTSASTSAAEWKFDASSIGTATHELLERTLAPVTYDPHRCRVISHDLAGQILATILGLAPKRYKLVTFVSIGSLKDDPGVQFGSRCLWDADTDQVATVRYANKTLFAVVMVYGLYRE